MVFRGERAPDGTPDLYALVAAPEIAGEDDEDRELLLEMAAEARSYLERHPWCEPVRDLRFGDGVGGIVAVFLAQIAPGREDVDEWLWVVVGDIPPLHLVTEEILTPKEALESYVAWRREWVDAVREERPIDDLPPVNAPPTVAHAEDLARRLDYIEHDILPDWT